MDKQTKILEKKEKEEKEDVDYLENLKFFFERADKSAEERERINQELKKIEERQRLRRRSANKMSLAEKLEKEKNLIISERKNSLDLFQQQQQLNEKMLKNKYFEKLYNEEKDINRKEKGNFMEKKRIKKEKEEKIINYLKAKRRGEETNKIDNIKFSKEVEKFKELVEKNSNKNTDFVLNFYNEKAYAKIEEEIFFISDVIEKWNYEKMTTFRGYTSYLFPSKNDSKNNLTSKVIRAFRTDEELRGKVVSVTFKILYFIFGYKLKFSKSKNKIKVKNVKMFDPEFQYQIEDDFYYKGGFFNINNLYLLKRMLYFLSESRLTILTNLIFLIICENMKDQNIKKFINSIRDESLIVSWIESQKFLDKYRERVKEMFIIRRSPERKSPDSWDDPEDYLGNYVEKIRKLSYLESIKKE
jgi:hypothetical protein